MNKQTSQLKRLNIKLENFHFFHKPSNFEDNIEDSKYISRPGCEHQLTNWLQNNDTPNGCYLITGYRGMGKSSLVHQVIKSIINYNKKKTIAININLGQKDIDELQTLHILTKELKEKTISQNYFLSICLTSLNLISLIVLLVLIKNFYTNYDTCSICTCFAIITSILLLNKFCINKTTHRLKKLYKRLTNTLEITNSQQFTLNAIVSFIRNFSQKEIIPKANIQEVQYELIHILDELQKECQFIIVFDELDKIETHLHEESKDIQFPEYQKLSLRPERPISSRERQQQVMDFIGNMKFFLSTAKAKFVFIAGHEMYEAFLSDMSDRDFSINSIFNGVLHVDSFLSSSRKKNNATYMVEEFLCRQLLPIGYNEYNLKKYMEDKNNTTINHEVLFLYHFITYLTFISNGSPKKLSLFLEKYVRKGNYLNENKKDPKDNKLEEDAFYLSFGYHSRQKINFIHSLTYPIIQNIISRSNLYGDKLLVSASFLVSYIFKHHNVGFSWRNLEQAPELQEINKTPEIREYLSTIIDYMNHTYLTTIPCGLYHYKFPTRIAEEISYHSRLSGEVEATFNFTPEELRRTRNYYLQILDYNEKHHIHDESTNNRLHHALGDTFMLEENYTAAIREYEICSSNIKRTLDELYKHPNSNTPSKHPILSYNQIMLKLGLAHEKNRTDNSAYIIYHELEEQLLHAFLRFPNMRYIFRDTRTMHLSLLAKLFVLEKIDTIGIQKKHITNTIIVFETIFKDNPFIAADFYRKLGDILYYKNHEFDTSKYKPANFYEKSIRYILNLKKELDRRELCINIYDKIINKKHKTLSDSYIRELAIACENMGHVCLADFNVKEENHNNLIFIFNLIQYFEEKTTYFKDPPQNNIEYAITYYLITAQLYRQLNEKSMATTCYKEIMHCLISYIQLIDNSEIHRISTENVFEHIAKHFLISQYQQYEHIHISEIDDLKDLGLKNIPFSHLSIISDIEETLYLYYTSILYCYIKTQLDSSLGKLLENNPLFKGEQACQNLVTTILNLKLKARINIYYKKNQTPEIIADTLFCLTRILDIIIPMRNTTLFNHLFKANIYNDLLNTVKKYNKLNDEQKEQAKKVINFEGKGFPNYLNEHYLAENAIYQYSLARQMHNQGKCYQSTIRELHFLDDDLSNNTILFYSAMERLFLKELTQDQKLKKEYKDSDIFNITKY